MEIDSNDSRAALQLNMDMVRELLVRFIRDQTRNAGFEKCVIGVSGGVDSAVSAFLAAEALGKKNVLAAILPYKTSSSQTLRDADDVVKALGITSETIEITEMVDPYAAGQKLTDKLRLGNIMARMRMIVLYDLSARDKSLVVGTSNKSELLVGYGTQFGDLACAINPLGDLYKTQIWQLAKALEIPKHIIEKRPTADLWPGQTDEDEMGVTYPDLDAILFRMIDERIPIDELVAAGFDKKTVSRVESLVRKNQFKRRPPLIAKISYRTINVDFRYVRDWGI
jgi:NAD+ synthase